MEEGGIPRPSGIRVAFILVKCLHSVVKDITGRRRIVSGRTAGLEMCKLLDDMCPETAPHKSYVAFRRVIGHSPPQLWDITLHLCNFSFGRVNNTEVGSDCALSNGASRVGMHTRSQKSHSR